MKYLNLWGAPKSVLRGIFIALNYIGIEDFK